LRRASRSSVFIFDFFHSRLGSGRGGDIGVLPLRQPRRPHHGPSSSRRSSRSWTTMASFSKYMASSRAFARGLL
jgi:hypothetical protein